MKGGIHYSFFPGRIDIAVNGTDPDHRIPEANDTITDVLAMFARMGLSNVDAMVLTTGSHTMGGVHKAISPKFTNETFTPFDNTPGVFDNDVFKHVTTGRCALPIDCRFAEDATLGPIMRNYAQNETAFFTQYALSFEKLLNLTTSPLLPAVPLTIPLHANLVAEGTRYYYPNVTYPSPVTTLPSLSATGTSAPVAGQKANAAGCPFDHAAGVAGGAAGLAAMLFSVAL
ncbi:heme peroxidase [Blyttiomyces helicus]|uniref:Peroxidase n=1 Tax=Blyttiomyces helicus TaxID=388810 RepID=A0A4P9VY09_9FUNG|nr:heme peroxidase [Blyttiomyces helicus]|eukprot:RKO83190.1 heme peroxidase [Blyttiomyces helicus]